MTDSVSLRVDYMVPVLTKSNKPKTYELRRFVLANRIGVDDYATLKSDANKLWGIFRAGFEAKLAEPLKGWPIHFRVPRIVARPRRTNEQVPPIF
jgi:hypothetical protein